MEVHDIHLPDRNYRYVFLVQNRNFWRKTPYSFDKEQDLVLTFDFALVREVTAQGGTAAYLDHLVETETMERYNYETYHFFSDWHRDENGRDIFEYKGVEVGNAFRMDIWSDITHYVRTWLNILAVKKLTYEKLYVGLEDEITKNILREAGLLMETWGYEGGATEQEYYFPIFRWMSEHVRPMRMKQRLIKLLSKLLNAACLWGERLRLLRPATKNIFVQRYYPTAKIIEQFKNSDNYTVVLEGFTWSKGLLKERCLPAWKVNAGHKHAADEMLKSFPMRKHKKLEIEGIDISDGLYQVIIRKIAHVVPESLAILDSVLSFFYYKNLCLMISITNLGLTNCLVMNYCLKNKIPTYLIINGMFLSSYLGGVREYSDWINAYSESIKNRVFEGKNNVVCLGDPRMDYYINNSSSKPRMGDIPTIVIGASGFNNIDLNSYVACEFDFLNDLMTACRILISQGRKMELVVKVRANGYIEQYSDFINEYYPELNVRLYDKTPMKEVLTQADFYISIYSQTIFEASCMGIPVLYYKKDTEVLHPPFDGCSELVTAVSVSDLVEKMELFYGNDPIYDAFKDRKIMEKYIGPLDGGNLKRNLDFIDSLIFANRQAEEAGDERSAAL